ncbi:hypothetical protein [Jiulongibacter sp. NS-SX5]|uniref:hypothetical protein n=1 Tax=Jiulongibacter sp. NS-SX5 TaxID=3463854 RepID=UPI00405A4196
MLHTTCLIFFLLFYSISPQIQLINNPSFLVNTMEVLPNEVLLANLQIFIFISIYGLSYYLLKGSPLVQTSKLNFEIKKMILPFIIVSVLAAFIAFKDIVEHLGSGMMIDSFDSDSLVASTLKGKILYVIPLVTSVILLEVRRVKGKNWKNLTLLIFVVLLLILCKNPIIDRRNSLGPVYLTILVLSTGNLFTKNNVRFFILNFIVLLILFPLSSLLTHVSFNNWFLNSGGSINAVEIITNHFSELHYDAYSNIVAVNKFIRINGHQYGNQMLGVILFFVPRGIWSSKPISTGNLLGEFLINDSSMWIDNISATFIVESLIDFGWFGLIIFPVTLAYSVKMIDLTYIKIKSFLLRSFITYTSFFMYFILRGALLPAWAYYSGSFIAFLLIPYLILKIQKLFSFKYL